MILYVGWIYFHFFLQEWSEADLSDTANVHNNHSPAQDFVETEINIAMLVIRRLVCVKSPNPNPGPSLTYSEMFVIIFR